MVQGGGIEARKSLLPEENIQKPGAVAEVTEHIPRQRHHQKWQHHAPADQVANAPAHEQWQSQHQRHQALGQHGQPEQASNGRQRTGIAAGDPRVLRDTSDNPYVRQFFNREAVAEAA